MNLPSARSRPAGRSLSWLIAALVVVAVVLGLARATAATGGEPLRPAEHVVVIGVAGMTWAEVSPTTTPVLWDLAEAGSVGSLTTRADASLTCPWDGWVTLGAGNRAAYPSTGPGCKGQDGPVQKARGTGLPVVAANGFGAQAGLLGASVRCSVTVGANAALAVAAPDAVVTATNPQTVEEWAAAIDSCPVTLVAPPPVTDGIAGAADLARVEEVVTAVRAAADDQTLVLVVGVAETGRGSSRLHPAIAAGAGTPTGLLRSSSTGRAPYVQLIDVAPTVLVALGEQPPPAMSGQPFLSVESAQDLAEVVGDLEDAGDAAVVHRGLAGNTSWAMLVVLTLGIAGAYALIRSGRQRAAAKLMLAVASMPVASFLLNATPWWKTPVPQLVTAVGTLVLGGLIAAAAVLGPWRRRLLGPSVAVAVVTAVVIGADILAGSLLQLNAALGYDAIVAGRFTGLGNMPFAVFATASLISLVALVHGRSTKDALPLLVVVGLCLIAVVGTPGLGADFGGVLSLVPAVALVTLIALRVRLTVGRLLLVAISGAAVVSVIAVIDYLRPAASQTHLGRFVGQVLDGTAWTVVSRKLDSNISILLSSPLSLLLPVFVATCWWLFRHPHSPGRQLLREHSPGVTAALAGVGVVALVGTAVNDSGVAVLAAAAGLGLPLLIAAVARQHSQRQPSAVSSPDPQPRPDMSARR